MNLPTAYIEPIVALGYMEPEARFLYVPATPSGYFALRQFLDFLVENPELDFLETEQDKVRFFCKSLGAPKNLLLARVYKCGPGSRPTVHFFVVKFPLFLAPPVSGTPPVVTLGYVDSGSETPSSFAAHLAACQGLFRQLSNFRFLYTAKRRAYFHKAEEQFRSLMKKPLESDDSSEIFRYFQIRKKWENHEYVIPVTEDLEFLKEARQRFQGDRFETLYRAWRFGELSDRELRVDLCQLRPDRTAFFDTYLVHRHGSLSRCGFWTR